MTRIVQTEPGVAQAGDLEVHEERGVRRRFTQPGHAAAALARVELDRWRARERQRLNGLAARVGKEQLENEYAAFEAATRERVAALRELEEAARREDDERPPLPDPFFQRTVEPFWRHYQEPPMWTHVFDAIGEPGEMAGYLREAPDREHWATDQSFELRGPEFQMHQGFRYWLPDFVVVQNRWTPFTGEFEIAARIDAAGLFSVTEDWGFASIRLSLKASLRRCNHSSVAHDSGQHRDPDWDDNFGTWWGEGPDYFRREGAGIHHVEGLATRLDVAGTGARGCFVDVVQSLYIFGAKAFAGFDLNGVGTILTSFPLLRARFAQPELGVATASPERWRGADRMDANWPLEYRWLSGRHPDR